MQTLLVGCGPMAVEYSRVLTGLGFAHAVVGRGETSAAAFEAATGIKPDRGGLDSLLSRSPTPPDVAIVAVGVEALCASTLKLIAAGTKRILVEKPAAIYLGDMESLSVAATRAGAEVYVAYNRRFLASTRKAREMLREDGGPTSLNFEFTEWSHVIEPLSKASGVKERWLISNSSHVIDLAFFLGGKPARFSAFRSGSSAWHEAASRFSGAGETVSGALFSYAADWDAPGRWAVEVCSRSHRLVFRPLEKLSVVRKGKVALEPVELDDAIDARYKPGLFLMTQAFFEGDTADLCTIGEQLEMMRDVLYPIAGYDDEVPDSGAKEGADGAK